MVHRASCAVIPVDSPTVANADTTSYSTSSSEKRDVMEMNTAGTTTMATLSSATDSA